MDCQWLDSAARHTGMLLFGSRPTTIKRSLSDCREKQTIRATFGRPSVREVNTVTVARSDAWEHVIQASVVSHRRAFLRYSSTYLLPASRLRQLTTVEL